MPRGTDQQQPQQYQYIKLPDGSYGKFRSDASDDDIRTAVSKDFPDAFKPPEKGAGTRFWEGVKAGSGGENALNTKVDPNHPIATNPMIPGAGVYRDIKSGNYAGAAGRVLGPGAILATALAGARSGEPVEPAIPAEGVSGGGLKKLFTSPLRYASRISESAVNQKLIPVKPLLNINTPADEAEAMHINIPGRDIGLGTNPAPVPKQPVPEEMSPAAEQLRSRIDTERGLAAQKPFPRISEGLPEVEEGQPQATDFLHREMADVGGRGGNFRMEQTPRRLPGEVSPEATRPRAFPARIAEPIPERKGLMLPGEVTDTRPARIGSLLNDATGGKPLISNVPIKNQFDRVTPVIPKESSVVKSHSYDPDTRELTVHTKNGGGYIHGDVSPEQAQAFDSAESKGSAWNDIRNNSTLVAKVVNGKRVPIKPTAPRIATPNDLTPILQESVNIAKSRKQ